MILIATFNERFAIKLNPRKTDEAKKQDETKTGVKPKPKAPKRECIATTVVESGSSRRVVRA